MKDTMLSMVCAGLVLSAAVPALAEEKVAAAAAEGSSPSVYVQVPVFSAYSWRGQVLDDKAVVQPYVFATHEGFNFTTWGNFSTSDKYTGKHDVSEIDLWLSYTFPFEAVEIWAGTINYLPTRVEAASYHEYFAWFKYPNEIVTPRLEIYGTYNPNVGLYFLAGLNREFKLTDKITVIGDVTAGYGTEKWNKYSFAVAENKMVDGSATLSAKYAINDSLSLTPLVKYVWFFDSKVEAGASDATAYPAAKGDPEMLIGGLVLDYAF